MIVFECTDEFSAIPEMPFNGDGDGDTWLTVDRELSQARIGDMVNRAVSKVEPGRYRVRVVIELDRL